MSYSSLIEQTYVNLALQGSSPPDPKQIVEDAVREFGDKLCVAVSFGRCSTAVLHIVLQVKPDVRVVFCNTGVEYPEIYAYRDVLCREWKLNLVELKPLKPFWECVREYGLPQIRKTKRKDGGWNRTPKCCLFLKEYPMRDFCKSNGIIASLRGLRAAESRTRALSIAFNGYRVFNKQWQRWNIDPIAFWTTAELLAYHKENNIPENPLYAKVQRSGCMPCTAFRNWQEQLSRTNPKMYTFIQHLKGVNLIPDFFQPEEPCLRPVEA